MNDELRFYIVDRSERGAGGCWVWQRGFFADNKYGQVRYGGKTWRAHRLAYTLAVGPVPPGLVVDHLCGNPSCVNPAHLEAVTQGENVRRGRVARSDVCRNGHRRTEASTYVNPTTGHRSCRACHRIGARRRTAA